MKKILITFLVFLDLVFAGGFVSSNSNFGKLSSVKQALNAKDNEKVIIKGYISKALGNKKYEFKDESGDTIIVKIDDKDWGGITVNENTFIEIYGEVNKKFISKNRIDIYMLKLVE